MGLIPCRDWKRYLQAGCAMGCTCVQLPCLCRASQRSTARCRLSHRSGVVLKARDRRSAISTVTGECPFTMAETVLRETPIRPAKSVIVSPSGSRYISLSISPGKDGFLVLSMITPINDSPDNRQCRRSLRRSEKSASSCRKRSRSRGRQDHLSADASGSRESSYQTGRLRCRASQGSYPGGGHVWLGYLVCCQSEKRLQGPCERMT